MINTLLGSGIQFPVSLDAGKIKTVDEIASVVSAIWLLFGTPKGKRFMLPEYGSNLYSLIFEPCNDTTGEIASIWARNDIEEWIPRVEYVRVRYELDNNNSTIQLEITFKLVNRVNEIMMIYPFYLSSDAYQQRKLDPNYTII